MEDIVGYFPTSKSSDHLSCIVLFLDEALNDLVGPVCLILFIVEINDGQWDCNKCAIFLPT